MNRHQVDQLVNALLYEGYLLYPYRPSVKNRQRWSFGGLYPTSYTEGRSGSDASAMQTQCLVRDPAQARLVVTVRFLQVVARRVGALEAPASDGPVDPSVPVRFVESLRVGNQVFQAWQEAIERQVVLDEVSLRNLAVAVPFRFGPSSEREPLSDSSGRRVGIFERQQRRLDGRVELSAEPVDSQLFRITVRIENRTEFPAGADANVDRDELLLHTFASTHTVLEVKEGVFLSLLDPPESCRTLAAGCRNEGAWPVLVGAEREADTMLSSPIILYDDPKVAPESPGDLFDATEIDEVLTLRIQTLSDEEKRTMATLDDRGRALLARTESLAREQLMELHGTLRDVSPVESDSGATRKG